MAPLRHKDSVAAYYSLDVRQIARVGALRPGARASCEIALIYSKGDTLEIAYSVKSGDGWLPVRDVFILDRTRCHYGGFRPWLVCSCGRRVAKLYFSPRLKCRHCLKLSYPCQSEGLEDRVMRRHRKLRTRLGGDGNLSLPCPEKPRYMHTNKYLRLWWKDYHWLRRWLDISRPKFERITGVLFA
jgi:hypothetical protein